MESQPTLVRPQSTIELDSESTIDVDVALVVFPWHAEDDLPFGLAEPLDHALLRQVGALREHRAERVEHLAHRLVKLRLTRVPDDH